MKFWYLARLQPIGILRSVPGPNSTPYITPYSAQPVSHATSSDLTPTSILSLPEGHNGIPDKIGGETGNAREKETDAAFHDEQPMHTMPEDGFQLDFQLCFHKET